jgi:hypothetical protein
MAILRRIDAGLLVLLGVAAYAMPSKGMADCRDAASGQVLNATAAERSNPGQVPRQFVDLWLRFHEVELCQELDAVFVFHQDAMEVWCRIEDEKSYQQFVQMISPLKASGHVDLYPTRSPAGKKRQEDNEPPASLWNNGELLSYFGISSGLESAQWEQALGNRAEMRHFDARKQRLLMYANQLQESSRKLKRLGGELPALALASSEDAYTAEQRRRATAVCQSHAQALDKNATRLSENLAQALPRGVRRAEDAARPQRPDAGLAPRDIAVRLADTTRSLSRRIYRFLYPQDHTVELTDLREPGLLESLRLVRESASEFQRALAGKH